MAKKSTHQAKEKRKSQGTPAEITPPITKKSKKLSVPKAEDAPIHEMTEEERQMASLLGFSSFSTTKGEHVFGTDVSAVDIIKVPKYRQYMHKKKVSKILPNTPIM